VLLNLSVFGRCSEKQSTSTASQAAGITVKQRLEKMREENALSCPPAHREEARKESALSSQNTFQFSQAQLQTLDVQMRQHVQVTVCRTAMLKPFS